MFVLFLGIGANSTLSYAKAEYTKKENIARFCDVSGNSKELNEVASIKSTTTRSKVYQPKK